MLAGKPYFTLTVESDRCVGFVHLNGQEQFEAQMAPARVVLPVNHRLREGENELRMMFAPVDEEGEFGTMAPSARCTLTLKVRESGTGEEGDRTVAALRFAAGDPTGIGGNTPEQRLASGFRVLALPGRRRPRGPGEEGHLPGDGHPGLEQIIAARDALPATERARFSAAITARILSLDAWRSARFVLAFMTFGSEVRHGGADRRRARRGAHSNVLPRVDYAARRQVLHGVADPATDLAAGKWGIREPDPARCPVADPAAIDFVVVPGVAFTVGGQRLGYGAGFYDRLIPAFPARPPLVAAAFELQVVDDLPMTERDQRVDLVVTEKDAYLAC